MQEEDFSIYNGEKTVLRKAQLRMLEILKVVDNICRKHNIPYIIDGGTCLGAIRHGGFIPWDDDLDISLMIDDYKRLCDVLKKELPEDLIFQDKTTDKYYHLSFAKVRDKNSFFYEPSFNEKVKEQGVFIDIFPLERGNVKIKRPISILYSFAFKRLRHNMGGKFGHFLSCLIWPFAKTMVSLLRFFSFLMPKDQLIYAYGTTSYSRHQLSKKAIFPPKPIVFEGYEFMGAANPDAYLKSLYGDYMKIPPKEKRQIHADKIEFYD